MQEGVVYAVEFSPRSGRDLIGMAKKRTNVIPIVEDARTPQKYRMLVSAIDVIFADVAQPDQARIVALNAEYFLKNGGHVVISIKASCVDSTIAPEIVFAREVDYLRNQKFKPLEQVTLEPYERDHAMVSGALPFRLLIKRFINSIGLSQRCTRGTSRFLTVSFPCVDLSSLLSHCLCISVLSHKSIMLHFLPCSIHAHNALDYLSGCPPRSFERKKRKVMKPAAVMFLSNVSIGGGKIVHHSIPPQPAYIFVFLLCFVSALSHFASACLVSLAERFCRAATAAIDPTPANVETLRLNLSQPWHSGRLSPHLL